MDDDFALLEAWRAGDEVAGNRLFHRHFERVTWFFRNKVDRDLDDLIQEAFLACLQARDDYRGESSFRAFLLGVARNVLRGYWRDRRRRGEPLDFGVTAVHDLGPSPSAIVAGGREGALVVEGLRRIPLDAQELLELFYWEQMTGPEIAIVLGVPEGTVRTRLRRARELLQREVERLAAAGDIAGFEPERIDDWASAIRRAPRDETPAD